VIRSFPRPRNAGQFVVALVATLLFVLPVYIALASAFKSQAQILSSPLGLPAPATLDNLTTALDRGDHLVTAGVANSLVITVLSVGGAGSPSGLDRICACDLNALARAM
jgi:raffinose/stachyose/melibiose transport system permease protein